ncbi:hypothetical protein ACFCXT_05830 [Streptomyces vinaceus]|uniref:hypothetical protein n=1 Tax=Streptomyces vinaceus TaxID=1960 RepID=UPI0035E38130
MGRSTWGWLVLLLTVVFLQPVFLHDQPAAAQPPRPVAALAPAAPEVQSLPGAFGGVGHHEGGGQGDKGVMRGRAHTLPVPARAGIWAGSLVRPAALTPRLPEPGTWAAHCSPGSSQWPATPDGEPTPATLQTFRC